MAEPQTAANLADDGATGRDIWVSTLWLDRPVLPAPRQVAGEILDRLFGFPVTSPHSLVFHAAVTAEAALCGFAIAVVLGTALAVGIVHARAFASHLPTLGADFVQTVLRAVLPGYAIGCAAGLLAAIALDRSDFLRRGVMPLGSLASAMPIVGIAPIMVMWFGFDWPSKAAVVVAMTFFPMLVQATAGLAAAGAMGRDLMRGYGAGYLATRLRLPAAIPFVFAALKLNATLALIGAIVAEFFGTPIVGMGFRISTEVARMNLDLVWAEIVLASLTGTLAFAALSVLERFFAFWHPSFR